jgi:2-dehydro-3-deoxygalactonokinase
MKGFISCDWGSTVLRVRFVDADEQSVLSEVFIDQRITTTFELWKQSSMPEENRRMFYLRVLKNQIEILEKQLGFSLKNFHLVMSGMASSNIGMMELPYKELPFRVDGSDLNVKIIQASDGFSHEILLISGAKTQNDVMRGEETQLVGCRLVNNREDQLFIFPGTHSKHILVKNDRAINFKTYMTGEFFSLLSKNSILSGNVEESDSLLDGDILKNFEEGVEISLLHNLLNASFLVRTNGLFNRNTKRENYYFLSGLLIGTELKHLINNRTPLTLVCNEKQKNYYFTAFQKMGIKVVQFQDAAEATIKGQFKIYNNYKPASKSLDLESLE